MKRYRGLLILLVLVALAIGHYLYWYAPRERAAVPEPGGLPARLLASGAWDACFWIPYPHQNLAKLQGAIGDSAAWVGAVARIAELPPVALERAEAWVGRRFDDLRMARHHGLHPTGGGVAWARPLEPRQRQAVPGVGHL